MYTGPGRADLQLPLREKPYSELTRNLAACFKVVNPEAAAAGTNRRYKQTDNWKNWGFNITCSTAKAAGGTGKTTLAWNMAFGLVNHGLNVVVINLDSQSSFEDRVLFKLLDTCWQGDVAAFYEQNGLAEREGVVPVTILDALNNATSEAPGYLIPPKALQVDLKRLASRGHQTASRGCNNSVYGLLLSYA